jgi:hypothetical protein
VLLKTHSPVLSLAWDGDDLFDAVAGGRRWTPDGTEHSGHVVWGELFDRAISYGLYDVLYGERGTKALVLKDGRLVRELNRSFYQTENYDYPVALGTLPDGRDVVVHCPDEYNILQVEELESGTCLTKGERDPADFFHSQLRVSPDGRRLLSAGWVWSPFGVARVFDLERAVVEPAVLDGDGVLPMSPGEDAEVISGCWLDADRVAVATGDDLDEPDEAALLGSQHFGVWSFAESAWLHRHRSDRPLGTVLGQGNRLISLSGSPRVLSVRTGEVLAEWPDIEVTDRQTCFGVEHEPTPVAALHPAGDRLAIAVDGGIQVLGIPDSA